MFDVENYFKTSSQVISELKIHKEKVHLIAKKIIECKNSNKKILVAGNGGSCADADHFSGELQCTYKNSKRSAVSAINIGGMPASLTAWANDFGFETYFEERFLLTHCETSDK